VPQQFKTKREEEMIKENDSTKKFFPNSEVKTFGRQVVNMKMIRNLMVYPRGWKALF